MNLLIMTALRPHSEEQIYPELSAFLPWRLVAHSCYVHLIVTNHPKLVRFLDFSKCPQWLENILFNRVMAKDDTDASITAMHIVMSSRGKQDDPEVHPCRLSEYEMTESERLGIPPVFFCSSSRSADVDMQLEDQIARNVSLLHITAKRNRENVLSTMQVLHMGVGPILKPEHMDEPKAKLVAECLTESLVTKAETPVAELEGMFSDLRCMVEVKVHMHMLHMLHERLMPDKRADYVRLAGVLLKEMTLAHCSIIQNTPGPFNKHPLLIDLVRDHPFLVIMNCNQYYGPIKTLSTAMASEANFEPWGFERMRMMTKRVDWSHFAKSRGAFTELVTSSAHMWDAMFWAVKDLYGRHTIILKALWVFLEENSERLMADEGGVYLEGEARVYLSRQPTSPQARRINFADFVLERGIGQLFTSLFMKYFHKSAGKVLAEPPIRGLASATALIHQYDLAVGGTFLRVQREFAGFPGTELVKAAHPLTKVTLANTNNTDMVGVNGVVNYNDVNKVLKAKFGISLQYLLRPNSALFMCVDFELMAWLGFMMHPLFNRLLPPFLGQDWDAPQRVTEFRFVDIDGLDSHGVLTHCVLTKGNVIYFWPTVTPVILFKVSLQIFDTYRLYLKEVMANTYREESMQTRFLLAAVIERKMQHFKSMAYNKTRLVPSEHPLFADGRVLSAITRDSQPGPSQNNAFTVPIELMEVTPAPTPMVIVVDTPTEAIVPRDRFKFDLVALESDVIHAIYLHLVRLQLEARPGVRPCFQAVIPKFWWDEAFQPVYHAKEVNNYNILLTPVPKPFTDADGRVLQLESSSLTTLGMFFTAAVDKQNKMLRGNLWERLTQGKKEEEKVVVEKDLNRSGYTARAFWFNGEAVMVVMPTPKILSFLVKF